MNKKKMNERKKNECNIKKAGYLQKFSVSKFQVFRKQTACCVTVKMMEESSKFN